MPLVSSLSLHCGSSVLITVSGDQFRSRLKIGIINWIPIDFLEVCSRYVSCIYSWYLSTHMLPALPLEYNGNLTPITIHYIALCIRYIFEIVLVDRNTFQFSNGKVNFLRWGLLVKTFIDYKFYILFQWIEKSAEKVEYNVRRLGGVRTGLLRRLSLTSYYFVGVNWRFSDWKVSHEHQISKASRQKKLEKIIIDGKFLQLLFL